MSQYTLFTVSVIKDSNIVTGTTGTTFLTKVSSGNAFKVKGSPVIYEVASVDSNTQLSLTSPYKGDTAYNVAYQITTDYTPNFGLVEVNVGDQDWPVHLTHGTIRKIDELLGSFVGGFIFKGSWDAAANNPTIPVATIGNAGWIYKVVKTGTTDVGGIVEWFIGDSLISNGTEWVRVPSSDFDKFAAESASDAAASALAAHASEISAGNSAQAADSSALTAITNANTATSAASSVTAQLIAFNKIFLGEHATDPVVDNNGDPLLDGVTYVNTTNDKIRIYSIETSVWNDYDEAAQTATTSAQLSATNAAGSAATATTKASEALTSANNAHDSEVSAASSAGTATTKAGEASVSATTATTKAGEASVSAASALEYLNSMREVTSAVVDGTGHLKITYSDASVVDAGYVKGAEGNGIISVVRTSGTGAAGTTDTYTITFTDTTTTTFSVYNGSDGADGLGAGDMLKSTYDTTGNGKVDIAEVAEHAPWSGITDTPSTYPPSTHNHDTLYAAALGPDDNYVTDLEKAALHGHTNTAALASVSGVNTGDQDLSGYALLASLGTMASQYDVALDGKQYVRKDKAWSEVVIPEGGVVSEAKSESFSAVNNRRYICDTSVGAFSVVLPLNPTVGDYIEFEDAGNTWVTNNLTILRNGQNIIGLSEDLLLDNSGLKISLTYVSVSYGWNISTSAATVVAVPHLITEHPDWPSSVTMTEVSLLDGVTSNIQDQIDSAGTPLEQLHAVALLF